MIELGHFQVTILEIIIDSKKITKEEIYNRLRDMMLLLGIKIDKKSFDKDISDLQARNFIKKVGLLKRKYYVTQTAIKMLFGEISS